MLTKASICIKSVKKLTHLDEYRFSPWKAAKAKMKKPPGGGFDDLIVG